MVSKTKDRLGKSSTSREFVMSASFLNFPNGGGGDGGGGGGDGGAGGGGGRKCDKWGRGEKGSF